MYSGARQLLRAFAFTIGIFASSAESVGALQPEIERSYPDGARVTQTYDAIGERTVLDDVIGTQHLHL